MNEARHEAYLNLIQSLLTCTNIEAANQILQNNSELVDTELVQVMTLVAESQRENDHQDAAYILTEFARQIAELLAATLDKSQLQFLIKLLQATLESKGNIHVIYTTLRDNINLVNDNFAVVLRNWAAETLPNLDDQSTRTIIQAIINFSDFMPYYPLGNQASNLEIAIAGYEVALTVITREEYAEYWAMIQNNLGKAYRHRIRGEQADNLEKCIAFYQVALSVYTSDTFPEQWAKTQHDLALSYFFLGSVYYEKLTGQKVDNLEKSIAFHQAALSVHTRKVFPQEWAANQNGLGNSYRDRIKGKKTNNLERSIKFFKAALSVHTRDAFPERWAMTLYNLGCAYRDRIRGEKADNLEISIKFSKAALSVYTRKAFPQDWAMTQLSLAHIYRDRIRGEKADNLEISIKFSKAALSVYTRKAFPQDWAVTLYNLGCAYLYRISDEKADNLESAIKFFKAALSVYTREAFPEPSAMTHNGLANAYSNRIIGEEANNLESAIKLYQAALSVYTRKAFPQEWAMTLNNLAGVYSNRIRGEKANNLESAIKFFKAALSVYTRDAFPINNASSLYGLGVTYKNNSQLPEAYNTFNSAIETVELMRSEIIIGGEADRQKLAEEWNKLYQSMVEVCLDMKNSTAALEYIERSKTRNLVELFHKARSLPSQVQRISFAQIRSLLAENEAILEWYITSNGFKVFIITRNYTQPDIWQSSYQDLQELNKFQQEYIDDYIQGTENWKNQLDSSLEKLAQILHIDEIIARLPENCQKLILVPFRYLHLFPLHALTSSREKADKTVETGCLLELFPGGVRYTPSCQLLQLSQRVNLTAEDSSPSRFFAIQNPTEDLDFTDIEVEAIAKSFNPAEVLSRQNASKTGLQQQIASLQNADIAHFSCHGFFDFLNPEKSALILAGAKITPLNPPLVRGETREDFPLASEVTPLNPPLVRGERREDFPLVSGDTTEDFPLVSEETEGNQTPPLSKGGLGGVPSENKSYIRSRRGENFDIAECLTLTEIFDLQLSKCHLVTLSACETGLTDARNTTDEYIGLTSGFFYAGATSVLSTLWAVNDVSTAILMIKFYELLGSESRPAVAIALRESQLWLRDLSVGDLLKWVAASELLSSAHKEKIQNRYRRGFKQDYQPYQSPMYWAPFCAVGQ